MLKETPLAIENMYAGEAIMKPGKPKKINKF
jgi:hypothetical protein